MVSCSHRPELAPRLQALWSVLNASVGKPAEGVAVSLECLTLTGKPEASPGRLGALATG
jgi:hypothetical protein